MTVNPTSTMTTPDESTPEHKTTMMETVKTVASKPFKKATPPPEQSLADKRREQRRAEVLALRERTKTFRS